MLKAGWPIFHLIDSPRRQWQYNWSGEHSLQIEPMTLLPEKDLFYKQPQMAELLEDDNRRRGKNAYEALKTVKPVFNASLEADIQALIRHYRSGTGRCIPAAWRWANIEKQGLTWKTNKLTRLRAALWILERLPTVETSTEAINQVACVLERVESLAYQRAIEQGAVSEKFPDSKLMRLTHPLPEICDGFPLLVGYGIRHITLFNASGAIQVQCLPDGANEKAVQYRSQAQCPERVLLNKPGLNGEVFWAL